MYRKKISVARLRALWKNSDSHIKITHGSENAYLKKSMDDICFQAELAETSWDYAYVICKGMKRLLEMGVPFQSIIGHNNLLQKLLYLGRDLMQTNPTEHNLFYLGVLVELKIYSKWKHKEFYVFLLNALNAIKNKMDFISLKIKQKLIYKLKKYNSTLYDEFFNKLSSA